MTPQHTTQYIQYLASPQWKAKRKRILRLAGDLCERCCEARAIEVHHLTYDRLGNEQDSDLQALCKPCHKIADQERVAHDVYYNGFETYAAKRWGDHIDYYEEWMYNEFDEWLDRKQGEEHW